MKTYPALLLLLTLASCSASPTSVRALYTLRSVDGHLQTRDIAPDPKPREAITGDDYFQIKLEHIFLDDTISSELTQLAIISRIDGLLPSSELCQSSPALPEALKQELAKRPKTGSAPSQACALQHVLSLNTARQGGHMGFDSVFISPPFKMGRESIGLTFAIAELSDLSLAQELLAWAQEERAKLGEEGFDAGPDDAWRTRLVELGFTASSLILEYAAKPKLVFEFSTDFVPVESVAGVSTPQNLLMGGDFIVFASTDVEKLRALAKDQQLTYESGVLYWKGSKKEYRDASYVAYKVVRQSRVPVELPVSLGRLSRQLERGHDPEQTAQEAIALLNQLQEQGVVSHTEGRYLIDLIQWYVKAKNTEAVLWSEEPQAVAAELSPLEQQQALAWWPAMDQAYQLVNELEHRIYDNYALSPGMWLEECVTIRALTQRLVDGAERHRPAALSALAMLQQELQSLEQKRERSQLSATQSKRLAAVLIAANYLTPMAQRQENGIIEADCPAIREKSLGRPCSSFLDCRSGYCVDGVCCENACGDGDSQDCQACSREAGGERDGRCTALREEVAPTVACRPAAGSCDLAEYCSASSTSCPVDLVEAAGLSCRPSAGVCDLPEACTGKDPQCPADSFLPESTPCRDSVGVCDQAEYCTGNTAACPVDRFLGASVLCRDADGACDAEEYCTGYGAECPKDALASAGTVCRDSVGVCDAPESCTGDRRECPKDRLAPNTTVCRQSQGECDVEEYCTGRSLDCPADGLQAQGTLCRASNGVCDQPELCTGDSVSCPLDAFLPPSVLCRDAQGVCDKAEYCSGNAAACPADRFHGSDLLCRDAEGVCDVPEYCDGQGTSCPVNRLASPQAVCRDAAGPCDLEEYCTGASTQCPSDRLADRSTLCRASEGACDVEEYCTGNAVSCPSDSFLPSTSLCRAASGPCDVEELCTGSSPQCPSDQFLRSGVVCREAAGICDLDEVCSGRSAECPQDTLAPSSQECRPASGLCDAPEYCSGTQVECPADQLAEPGTICRPPEGACDQVELCTGSSKSCPEDTFVPAGRECRGAVGVCDQAEQCTGAGPDCPSDRYLPSGNVCRQSAGDCDVAETCTGASAACPADDFASPKQLCRPANGACDSAEHCSGRSASCPPDALAAAGTVCREATDACDGVEVCDGGSAACPEDLLLEAGTVCRPAVDVCDREEACSGVDASCPDDLVVEAGVSCRASQGVCDAEEFCDGRSGSCPSDSFLAAGTVCAPGSCVDGVQRAEALCSGEGPLCLEPEAVACEPFICGKNACLTTCEDDADCVPEHACREGLCVPTRREPAPEEPARRPEIPRRGSR